MPWKEVSIMSEREEFVRLALQEGANKSELCRRFKVSRPTGDKWIARFGAQGRAGLADRSRRPEHTPTRVAVRVEDLIVRMRQDHRAWGARTIRARLLAQGHSDIPNRSTVHAVLLRHGLIDPEQSAKHTAFKRFEREQPNALWQMDFKGHFPLLSQQRCHPLTVLDDHSRFNVCLQALANEQGLGVQQALTQTMRCYGMPEWIITDNGGPWGDGYAHSYTALSVWLIRLGIGLSHSRPYHPQTMGKDERFHRTLNAEVICLEPLRDLAHAQQRFDLWRPIYNFERPHQGLDLQPPSSRYRPSARVFPEHLPALDYPEGLTLRRVQSKGELHYRGQVYRVGTAFRGYTVALRPHLERDGVMQIYFCHQRIAELNLHLNELTHV
jgi:transposase InsO family protein